MKPNQLDEASKHAWAGTGSIKQGEVKLSGDDHQNLVQESFEQAAEERMQAAVEKLRGLLARKDLRGKIIGII